MIKTQGASKNKNVTESSVKKSCAIPPSILRSYDIRGTYGKDVTDPIFLQLGKHFGGYLHTKDYKRCVVGRDGRTSSKALQKAFIEGMRYVGIHVIDIGCVPTPAVYHAQKSLATDAGAMITGSHNPVEDNGLKLLTKEEPFFETLIQELPFVVYKEAETHGSLKYMDTHDQYVSKLFQHYSKKNRRLRIAWDPGNGACCDVMHRMQKRLPHKYFNINDSIDGTFPAHLPDPTQEENLEGLRACIQKHACDFGIAFDGDGDRLVILDETGRLMAGDRLFSLFIKDTLSRYPKKRVIYDVKASSFLPHYIKTHKGIPVLNRTGHSWIKKRLKETQAILAGEVSGHYFFNDTYYGYDDGLYAALRFIQIMEKSNQKASHLLNFWPALFPSPELKIPCADDQKFNAIEKIQKILNDQGQPFDCTDGLRVETPSGWYILRASNTGPHLIGRIEADSEEALGVMKKALNMLLVTQELSLPIF